jgi:hypothetical protein
MHAVCEKPHPSSSLLLIVGLNMKEKEGLGVGGGVLLESGMCEGGGDEGTMGQNK